MGKKTITIMMCDQCGSLVGDTDLHGRAQHPTASSFSPFKIVIPVAKRKKKDGKL